MKFLNYKNKAFTLAEVLITLAIIGIVAAITIPALINNIQNNENITALKSFYSDISNATTTIKQQNDGTMRQTAELNATYASVMNVSKICTSATAQGNCWHTNAVDWYYLNGNVMGAGATINQGFILNNGMLVNIPEPTHYPNCNGSNASLAVANNDGCGWIIVDVNGFKKPDTIGKDIFYFQILKDKVVPMGGMDSSTWALDCSTTGLGCADKYLK